MPLHTVAEIDRLEELLSDIEVMPDAMCASELDGYVAGLLLCPEMIMPSEWLPEVWGLDGEPEFASIEQAEETIGAVMAHYNRVAENLASRRKPYEIVLEQAEGDDQPFWEFWIAGFYHAMRLRPDAWEAYLNADNPEVKAAFAVMVSLVDLSEGESKLPADLQEEFEDQAVVTIPQLVIEMNDWIKSQVPVPMGGTPDWFGAANMNAGPARSNKVGRNEPCSCGSGRKYKRCCGSN